MKKTGRLLYWIILLLLILIASAVALSAFDIPGGYKLFSVLSGSMEPSIQKGAVVMVVPQEKYNKGDIVTYRNSDTPDVTITHRIFEVQGEDQTVFITKGDANETPDNTPITPANIIGKVIFSLPLLGYPVGFAKTQMGLMILIIVPATIIIYSELMAIKNEALRLIKERKERKLTPLEKAEVAVGEEVLQVEKEVKKIVRKKKKK